MPIVQRDDGATIYYEVTGNGFPVLLLAPGGLNSAIQFWERMPLNPRKALADEFQLIVMDQRNVAGSRGPLDTQDPWGMYAGDQLAVLDALGVQRAHVVGCCIGSSFIFRLLQKQPERFACAVPMQPIGTDETNTGVFGPSTYRPWGAALIENGADLTMETVEAFGEKLFEAGFVFSVSRDFLRTVQAPMLLLYGDDPPHPRGVSEEVHALLPNVQVVERWRPPDATEAAMETMRQFLRSHTPKSGG